MLSDKVHAHTPPGVYDITPTFPVPEGQVAAGYDRLAEVIKAAVQNGAQRVALDGFSGVLWAVLQEYLDEALRRIGLEPQWYDTAESFLPEELILEEIRPSLGGNDPLFGQLYRGDLSDFLDVGVLQSQTELLGDDLKILYGPGAALVGAFDFLIYADVPKDEIQRRMRGKTVSNLGATSPADFDVMYKRAYFVDWPALNRHKARLLPDIDWLVDAQDPERPTLISGEHLRSSLDAMASSYFRVRPWFLPGPWGGQWMKEHFPGLAPDAPNYAWSYELIAPENGLVVESGRERLECSFDLLMYQCHREVLGRAAERFGHDFPIRFDYLDTSGGGNLSIQVHPRPEYIRERFGEPFTQDESYYIVTSKPGARVYLGFRDGVDPDEFRHEVERSQREGVIIDVDSFVNSVQSGSHDLFLIPHGTIHGSGADNLVLEISATPYIYTFKIYDWMRRDLEGKLRPLNIERAWENLYFERQEDYVREYLCPKPRVLREGPGWREVFVGTHEDLFYVVHRYEFDQEITAETCGSCHMLNVVEGLAVRLETADGRQARFNFGETFVIPAAAGGYRLSRVGDRPVKVVMACVK